MYWQQQRRLLHVADDRGSGPAVILLHGIASSSVTFENVIPLIESGHRCVSIDLLGFGGSPIIDGCEYTLGDHVAAIHRTVRSLRLRGPFTLVGHSMGSLIAARYAARHKREVTKLVLVSPPIYLAPAELSDDWDRDVMELFLKAYRYLRGNKEFTLRNAQAIERLLPIHGAMDINERTWTPFVKSLENAIESQTTLSDLAAVDVPVDVVYGVFDEFRSEGTMRIVERLNGVEVHRVAASDHLIGYRLAREVSRLVA